MSAVAVSPPGPPSRYRSQRQKRVHTEPEQLPTRSKSRYHRKQGPAPASSPLPVRPASPEHHSEAPVRYHSKHRGSPLKPLYQEQVVQAPQLQPSRTVSSENHSSARHASPPAGLGALHPSKSNFSSGDERDSDAERRQQTRDRSSNTVQPAPAPPVQGELFPRPMAVGPPVRHDGPPQSGQIRATQSMSELQMYTDEDKGCFGGFFKRKRGEAGLVAGEGSVIARPKAGKDEPIRPGGGGVVPGIDAPKSAVNSGSRRVLVECQKSQRWFQVTPETTSIDIIKSAATIMSERIDIKSALLVETFRSVGVQRPLRRYEQIRDVLNSWDEDEQNKLILVDPGTGTIEPELTVTGAPKECPEGETWLLTSSYRPGKWEKRYVTLKPDGQLIEQKDLEKPNSVSNVCHMSDFDIYTPTTERKKGKIKPPKKYCFAIKSQQKTTMFESTEDYVHFFCTADPTTSDSFYRAIQGYRSWYLVNVRGVGQKEKPNSAPAPAPVSAPAQSRGPLQTPGELHNRRTSTDFPKSHRAQESMESHYQLGSFKPWIDEDQFEKRPLSSGSGNGRASSGSSNKPAERSYPKAPVEKRSNTVNQIPPAGAVTNRSVLADDEPLVNLGRSTSISNRLSFTDQRMPATSEFKDTSLLGRNYSQRRKELERDSQQHAFSTGPSLLNGGLAGRDEHSGPSNGVQRQQSTRKHNSNNDMKRSSSTRGGAQRREQLTELDRTRSQRQKPKPLIDLTPEYKEPPQHKNKGRGHKPERLGSGGLIEAATSPEDPLNIPQNTVFRNVSGGPHSMETSQVSGLVDLTAQHREPVHHARKARGYTQDRSAAGGLIQNASNAENPYNTPQKNNSRSMNAMPESRAQVGSAPRPAPPPQHHLSLSNSPADHGFTGEGLPAAAAAANRQGWGTGDKGRGVIDGSRAAGKPLVDFSEDSQYVKGSLLNNIEKAQGGPMPTPVVDRADGGRL